MPFMKTMMSPMGGSESTVANSDQDNEDVSSEEMDMWDEEEVEVESQVSN
jgi:hypothetical protein